MLARGSFMAAPITACRLPLIVRQPPALLVCLCSAQPMRLHFSSEVCHGRVPSTRHASIVRLLAGVTMHGSGRTYGEAEVPSNKSLSEQVAQLLSTMVALTVTTLVAATALDFRGANAVESLGLGAGEVFQNTCSGCHSGGSNILQPAATLFKKDLEKNGLLSADDIYNITYSGKNRMPGYGEKCTPRGQCTFGPRLSEEDIRALAEFVKMQADQGWDEVPK